jgi:peptidoglycan biosynthesis protein MviN/MurJ (putative lipid II flippase)
MSGECIARGAPVTPIAVQATRSMVPALVLVAWPHAPVVVIAAMLPVGEAVRAGVLGTACRRLRMRQEGEATGDLLPHGLVAQSVSSGVTQLGPAVDRSFLAASGAGSVSSYEMSDRLMYAASQFFTMTFIYRRVAVWARLPTMEDRQARGVLRGDARTLGGLALALTLAAASACVIALASGLLPPDWRTGFWWGALVMLSLPAHLFNVVGTRLLVIGRRPRPMLWIAVATALVNAAMDALFFWLLGPVGVVLATVLVRWTMAGVYLHLLRKVVPATVGRDRVPE